MDKGQLLTAGPRTSTSLEINRFRAAARNHFPEVGMPSHHPTPHGIIFAGRVPVANRQVSRSTLSIRRVVYRDLASTVASYKPSRNGPFLLRSWFETPRWKADLVRILHIGDIVGSVGVRAIEESLSSIRADKSIDLVTANAENAESGSGITKGIFRRLIAAGVDCITLGDHIFRKREIIEILESDERIVRPANYPPEAPGRTWTSVSTENDISVVVISLMGRVFMRPVDCPFHAADRVLAEIPEPHPIIIVDIHAEATSDKQVMGHYLDGRVSAVLGTHTHVPTADECILPNGTAFQCDVGMTGPHLSILGRRIDRVTETTITFNPSSFLVAKEDVRINGTIVDVDESTRRAISIERLTHRIAAERPS